MAEARPSRSRSSSRRRALRSTAGTPQGRWSTPRRVLAAHPRGRGEPASTTAAILGDEAAVPASSPRSARAPTAKGGPRGWDALTYLCFSEIPAARSRALGRLRPGGGRRCSMPARARTPDGSRPSPAGARVGERALRGRRRGPPRGADAPAARARRGPERRRDVVSRAGKLRQRAPCRCSWRAGSSPPRAWRPCSLRKARLARLRRASQWLLEHGAEPELA